jgi:carbamoyltransferase
MNILGFAGLNHDPSIAILNESGLCFAIESEKITRHKHEISVLPTEALEFSLDSTGIVLDDIDVIATNWKAGPLENYLYIPQISKFAAQGRSPISFVGLLIAMSVSHTPLAFRLRLQRRKVPPIVRVRHHLAHIGSCYTLSPYSEAAVAVIDGSGELECTSTYKCSGTTVRKLWSMDLPHNSLGHRYSMTTAHLGFKILEEEYKVMGLAAFGEPRRELVEFFQQLIRLLPEGRYRVDRRLSGDFLRDGFRFSAAAKAIIGEPRKPGSEITAWHENFAFAMQQRVNEAVLHVLRHLRKSSGMRRLCLSGGVALNAAINGNILNSGDFDEVFIPPAPHDAGTSVGAAAFYAYHMAGRSRPEPMRTAYLGPEFDDNAIKCEVDRTQVPYTVLQEPSRRAAELLAAGKVVGWFQGKAEFGPRALGNRSILADPRDARIRDRLNNSVKQREAFRPFAPSILQERMSDYFETLQRSPFMLFIDKVRPSARATIAAAVHVDGSARPQSVAYADNPQFHGLIEEFCRLTSVPAVLNTSFNVAGEPIVTTPSDAIRCFYGSGLDALIIGRFEMQKRNHLISQ